MAASPLNWPFFRAGCFSPVQSVVGMGTMRESITAATNSSGMSLENAAIHWGLPRGSRAALMRHQAPGSSWPEGDADAVVRAADEGLVEFPVVVPRPVEDEGVACEGGRPEAGSGEVARHGIEGCVRGGLGGDRKGSLRGSAFARSTRLGVGLGSGLVRSAGGGLALGTGAAVDAGGVGACCTGRVGLRQRGLGVARPVVGVLHAGEVPVAEGERVAVLLPVADEDGHRASRVGGLAVDRDHPRGVRRANRECRVVDVEPGSGLAQHGLGRLGLGIGRLELAGAHTFSQPIRISSPGDEPCFGQFRHGYVAHGGSHRPRVLVQLQVHSEVERLALFCHLLVVREVEVVRPACAVVGLVVAGQGDAGVVPVGKAGEDALGVLVGRRQLVEVQVGDDVGERGVVQKGLQVEVVAFAPGLGAVARVRSGRPVWVEPDRGQVQRFFVAAAASR